MTRTPRRKEPPSESETTETESESESSGSNNDEPPSGTRAPRRRIPRPSPRQVHGDGALSESVDHVIRERVPNGETAPPLASPHKAPVGSNAPSPRPRPVPAHGRVASSDPRRRSQGGIFSDIMNQLPVIGNVVKEVAGARDAYRRPHSHDSRYQPNRAPRRYSDEEIYSSDDEYSSRRRPVRNMHSDVKERITGARLEKEQRERRREYDRDRDRDDRERVSRHLRRPEAVRRSSSHAEGERRARERDRDYYNSRYMMPPGRGSRGLSPGTASGNHRRFAVPADGRGYD